MFPDALWTPVHLSMRLLRHFSRLTSSMQSADCTLTPHDSPSKYLQLLCSDVPCVAVIALVIQADVEHAAPMTGLVGNAPPPGPSIPPARPGTAAGAAKAGMHAVPSTAAYSAAAAARLREAGLIDSDDDSPPPPHAAAALAVHDGSGLAAPVAVPCGVSVPTGTASRRGDPEAIDVIGDTDEDDEQDDADDIEAMFDAAATAERLARERLSASGTRPGAHAFTSASPHTPAPPAGATGGIAVPLPDPASSGGAAAVSPPQLAGAEPSTQSRSGGYVAVSAEATPVLQQVLATGAPAAGATAATPAHVAACTPGSWGPGSAWSVPEHPGLPGVVKYEAVDDYGTDHTGSTIPTQDHDTSPAGVTPSIPYPGVALPPTATTTRHHGSAAGAPAIPPVPHGDADPAMIESGPSLPLATTATGSPLGSLQASQKNGKGPPVVKLPSLRRAMKRSPPAGDAGPGRSSGAAAQGSARVDARALGHLPVADDDAGAAGAAVAVAGVGTGEAAPAVSPGKPHATADSNVPRSSQPAPPATDKAGRSQASAPCTGPPAVVPDVATACLVGGQRGDAPVEVLEMDTEAGAAERAGARVILHVDVDSFYCQVRSRRRVCMYACLVLCQARCGLAAAAAPALAAVVFMTSP